MSLKELADEYRFTAAQLSIRIDELRAAGADAQRINALQNMRKNVRELAQTLSGYYDLPRQQNGMTAVGWPSFKGKV